MWLKAVERAVQDIEAAPDIAEARTVELVLKIKPVVDCGELDKIDAEFGIKGKVPTRSTSLQMWPGNDPNEPTRQRRLMWAEDSPDNPDQGTLYGDQEGDSPDAEAEGSDDLAEPID